MDSKEQGFTSAWLLPCHEFHKEQQQAERFFLAEHKMERLNWKAVSISIQEVRAATKPRCNPTFPLFQEDPLIHVRRKSRTNCSHRVPLKSEKHLLIGCKQRKCCTHCVRSNLLLCQILNNTNQTPNSLLKNVPRRKNWQNLRITKAVSTHTASRKKWATENTRSAIISQIQIGNHFTSIPIAPCLGEKQLHPRHLKKAPSIVDLGWETPLLVLWESNCSSHGYSRWFLFQGKTDCMWYWLKMSLL